MRFQVTVGTEFDVEQFEVSEAELVRALAEDKKAQKELEDARHRRRLSLLLIAAALGFIIVSALIGLFHGNFDRLQTVYNVVAPFGSAIMGYYFGQTKTKDG